MDPAVLLLAIVIAVGTSCAAISLTFALRRDRTKAVAFAAPALILAIYFAAAASYSRGVWYFYQRGERLRHEREGLPDPPQP